jgi:hypothetical protein
MPDRNDYCEAVGRKDLPLKVRTQHIWKDTLATVGVLAFVMTVLVAVDERVREEARLVIAPDAFETIGSRFNEAGSAILEAVRTQSIEHAPMMTFIAVATILLLAMMRT